MYRLLVESVRDYAIIALDPHGRILTWNLGAYEILGYARDEVIGRHFTTFYPPEDIDAGKAVREIDVATREGRFEDEGWRIRKDGARFWANVIITALRGKNGALEGFAKVVRDLSDRRIAEQALRRSEERFRLLVGNVREYGIFMLDPMGRIASWNEGAQRIKGYTAGEAIGQHFSVFYPPEEVQSGKPTWELEVAVRDGRFEEEGWRLRKDGTRFWANVVITALRNDIGELVGFAKVTRDLTERLVAQTKALEDARRIAAQAAARDEAERRSAELAALNTRLREQTAELELQRATAAAANKSKSEFLAAMSHELRTPLNAIGGYVELLTLGLRGPITEQQREDLERVRKSQQHLLALINDVLNFSRIEAGQLDYDIAVVPLDEIVDSVVMMIVPQAHIRGLALSVTGADICGPVMADAQKVEQILLNLLSNAVKFTPKGGSVSLSCARDDDLVAIRVRDTGIGIPADKLDHIFEPFVQVGRSLTSQNEGAGLGLSISRDLAQAMNGDLRAESEVAVGSTFILTLPAADDGTTDR